MSGVPQLFTENDVHAGYPVDMNDECLAQTYIHATSVGDHTGALYAPTLFHGSRILAEVLQQNCAIVSTHELALPQMRLLESKLTQWYTDLPPDLRVSVIQGKLPDTFTGGRAYCLVSLSYHQYKLFLTSPRPLRTITLSSSFIALDLTVSPNLTPRRLYFQSVLLAGALFKLLNT